MKPMMKGVLAAAGMLVFAIACNKELSNENGPAAGTPPQGTQQVNLFLTDDPALFDSVVVNIQFVKVRVDTCSDRDDDDSSGTNDDSCKVWYDLGVKPGYYDLLSLRNGLDTLLASGNVPAGMVQRIRIELGTSNYLVKDSVRYPLNLMPGRRNVVEIKLKNDDWDDYDNRRRRIWLDFDVARSIIKVRDGEFYLVPNIKPFTVKKTGSIEGRIVPLEARAVVSVYNSTDTAFALPNHKGEFKIRGLKAGDYTMFINAGNGYLDSTIAKIAVLTGKETKLGTVALRK
jgi:Domain of unknown function (DUF4382)